MKLSLALKETTKNPHQQLEKIVIHKLKGIKATSDYIAILNFFYGFIRPLEEKIARVMDESLLPDYGQRRKSDTLLADLDYLQSDLERPVTSNLPEITNTYQAIGALYVLEGSTLGGEIISKMLSDKLRLDTRDGLSYFVAYGDNNRSMWQKFQQMLDDILDAKAQAEVLKAAEQTFIKFKNWLEHE